MSRAFIPPSDEKLHEVDVAKCEYSSTVVEIEGLVSPASQGGWPRSKEYSVHTFTFAAWRYPGGPLQRRDLTILRPVAPDSKWTSDFPSLSIHRIRVRLSTDESRAVFAGNAAEVADQHSLAAVAKELAQPVVIATDRFGNLTLDRSLNMFEGEAIWNGTRVRLCFDTDGSQDVSRGLKVAERLWDDEKSWKQRIEDHAIANLLTLRNEDWLQDGEATLTSNEFRGRMKLMTISIDRDGGLEFWHDDGDLFGGHSILVSGSIDDGPTEADIAG